jgi:hypothetical protein
MNKSKLFLLAPLIMVLCVACSSARHAAPAASEKEQVEAPAMGLPAPQADMAVAEESMAYSNEGYAEPTSQAKDATGKRLVIMNADLSIVVADPQKKMNEIANLAQELGGFVVTSGLNKMTLDNGVEVPHASITIRVLAENFNSAIEKIKDGAIEVNYENRTGQDVTKEYTDLQSRLRSRQDAEARLKEIMASATKTEDVLDVFNQLTQVQQEIEVLKGQIKYYEESAALSAISVNISAEASVQPLKIGGWQPVGVARDAVQALISALKGIVNIIIWLIIFILPLALVIYLPARGIWVLVKRWRAKHKAAKGESMTPPDQPKA